MRLLLLFVPAALASLDMPMDLTQLYSRDVEPVPGPIAFGHKFMTGGAGEGSQHLSPLGEFPNREEIKTDAILPAYCEPPNPCPVGFSPKDGCITDFDNTAEFSRDYQGKQDCLCDEEHMFSCPSRQHGPEGADDFSQALDELLMKNGIDAHKELIAKKFHEKKRQEPRKKRASNDEKYLWQQGEPLLTIRAKKG